MRGRVEIGDLATSEGRSLAFEANRLATSHAEQLLSRIQRTQAYKQALAHVQPDVLDAYFVQYVWEKLAPALRDYCIEEHLSASFSNYRPLLRIDDSLLALLFREQWRHTRYEVVASPASLRSIKHALRRYLKELRLGWTTATGNRDNAVLQDHSRTRIAVEAGEGVDLGRRSDIFWLDGSSVDPKRVLVYFSYRYPYLDPIDRTVARIRQLGMTWVSLRFGVPDKKVWPWSPGYVPSETRCAFAKSTEMVSSAEPVEGFAIARLMQLFKEVDYWRVFFRTHHAKVHYSISSSGPVIAKRIALDLENGVDVGTQRSFISSVSDSQGRRPQSVYFVWGETDNAFQKDCRNCNKSVLVSGFVYDSLFQQHRSRAMGIRNSLMSAGAKIIVALADNSFGNFHITRSMIIRFYETFLNWMLASQDVGLVIKPKRPQLLETLPSVCSLMAKAKATGRCFVVPNALGRMPSEASSCADMTVGIFLSSSVIEAAIAGYRGLHCDLTRSRWHWLYAVGYEKVVFDDLDRLLAALNQFKENPQSVPGLGDHSFILDHLDPFRDGKAGRRVGEYMGWLLEALDEGCDRDGAIARANQKYAALWGSDKVMQLTG